MDAVGHLNMRKQVLVTPMEGPAATGAAGLRRQRDYDLHHAPWDDFTLDLVQSTGFDIIVIGFPIEENSLRRFIRCVRAPGSACRRSGVVLLARRRHLAAAKAYVGLGINRAVGVEEGAEELAASIDDLCSVAPRVALRAPTRIILRIEDRPLRAFCQTENVSTSGMLLRGFGHYPTGTTIDFEINIPGQSEPIRGSAEITRTTNVAMERLEGVGARFLSFLGADESRLSSYVEERLN
jgi:hypothetical protein